LRTAIQQEAKKRKWKSYIPAFKFTTDNAAMIAITGYYKYKAGEFTTHDIIPLARFNY
jgi:N6-L-threonylcarbamoyladenine synthase